MFEKANSALEGGYNGFSGVNMEAFYKNKFFGDVQGISYSIFRDMAPIYTQERGSDPRAFACGKRTIAGSLVFYQLDLDVFFDDCPSAKWKRDHPEAITFIEDDLRPWYPDQIPPFDICFTASNEHGDRATRRLAGVELLYKGYGASVSDIVPEKSYTYIAQDFSPWVMEPKKEENITFPTLREFLW